MSSTLPPYLTVFGALVLVLFFGGLTTNSSWVWCCWDCRFRASRSSPSPDASA